MNVHLDTEAARSLRDSMELDDSGPSSALPGRYRDETADGSNRTLDRTAKLQNALRTIRHGMYTNCTAAWCTVKATQRATVIAASVFRGPQDILHWHRRWHLIPKPKGVKALEFNSRTGFCTATGPYVFMTTCAGLIA